MFLKQQQNAPLMKGIIVHSQQGRIRIRCLALKHMRELHVQLEEGFAAQSAFSAVRLNYVIGTALIHYDHGRVGADQVMEIFEEVLSPFSLHAYKKAKETAYADNVTERNISEMSAQDVLKRIALSAGVIGYEALLSKRLNLGQTFFGWSGRYSRFFSLSGVTSLYLSKSLVKSGLGALTAEKRPNADTLTLTSIVASLLLGKGMSALTITLLSDIAELMTIYTMEKTRDSIKGLLSLNEEFVWKVEEDGEIRRCPVEQVLPGDKVLVHTGEKICVDGIVVAGEALVDEAAITGEYLPDMKQAGHQVFAGSILKNGNLTVETRKAGDDTVVSRIIHMVEDAAGQKAQIQNYADKISNYLVPFNFLLAGVTFLATKSPVRALNMLVIDYSCGIKLSTATAFTAAINSAVKNGVLIKGGNFIESMARADTLIFDKTGTLTEGKPNVVQIVTASRDITEARVLELAGAAEETSSHPLADAVLSYCRKQQIVIPKHGEIVTVVGKGMMTEVDGRTIRVGSVTFMEENGIDPVGRLGHLPGNGATWVFVAEEERLLGALAIHDKTREHMRKAVNNLRHKGVHEILLLTGDRMEQAEAVAGKIGVDAYEAQLLPEDKARIVLSLQANGSKVVMVGDGINDAPALAFADVGLTLGGKSTDIAIESSDITIHSDNPMLLPVIMGLSQKTMGIVKQNFGLVIGINTLGLVLSGAGVLSVFWSAVLHNSSTIFVVSNSLRLLFHDMDKGM
ncbi:MAG: cation-transporting ATPase [Paenibacillaceae bacterium]|jgi:cation-transporting P-type ATPase C|nr:cation-transporting ATPase [Paenibacillaceae bacterium]